MSALPGTSSTARAERHDPGCRRGEPGFALLGCWHSTPACTWCVPCIAGQLGGPGCNPTCGVCKPYPGDPCTCGWDG